MKLRQLRFEVSHPSRKNKNAARVGHPYSYGILHGHLLGLKAGRALVLVASLLLILCGCGHHVDVSPLPETLAAPPEAEGAEPAPSRHIASTPTPQGVVSAEDRQYIRTHKPILTEEGVAS